VGGSAALLRSKRQRRLTISLRLSESRGQVLWAFGFAGLGVLRSEEIDPLLHREGDLRNRWQAVANVLFTMRSFRQLVATDGNGFGLFLPFLASVDLRPIATGCNHGAP
jgi:hypothetical protein